MSETDYLDRYEQAQLRKVLKKIPGLMEDLLNVQTKQARITKPWTAQGRRPKRLGSAIPYNIGASDAADRLHNVLVGWVRVVLDQRGGEPPANAVISCAAWLARNLESLALCEGSAEAKADIEGAVIAAERVVDIPPDDYVVIDPQRVEAANKSLVTLATIGAIAARIGPLGEGLNRDRLRLLVKHGDVKADAEDRESGTKFYRLGDVLDAHQKRKVRGGKKVG